MARFSRKDIFFKDNDMAVFGTDQDSRLYWDDSKNELTLTSTISGVDPTQGYHLATKDYVDTTITGVVSGDYVKRDGTTMLTNDWDAGNYQITVGGIKGKDETITIESDNSDASITLDNSGRITADTTDGFRVNKGNARVELLTSDVVDYSVISTFSGGSEKSVSNLTNYIASIAGNDPAFYGFSTTVKALTTVTGAIQFLTTAKKDAINEGSGNIEYMMSDYITVKSNGEGDIDSMYAILIEADIDGWDEEAGDYLDNPGNVSSYTSINIDSKVRRNATADSVNGIAIGTPEVEDGGSVENVIGLYIASQNVGTGYGLNISSIGGLNMFAGPMVVGGVQTSPTHTFQVMNDAGTSHDIAVTLAGNVGFGVASPDYKVHVDGDGYFTGNVIASTPVSGTHLATKQYVDDAVGSGVYWTKTGSTLHPTNVNNNVSIGTTITGTASLNVYEQVYLHEFTGGTTQLVLDNSMTAEGGESYISFKDDGDIVGVFRAGSSELEFTAYSNQSRDMIVQTGNDSDGTNDTYLRTGDASGGDSGNVYISTGTAGGTKGSVYVQSELDMSSNKIVNLESPTTYSGAANKGYVDDQLSSNMYPYVVIDTIGEQQIQQTSTVLNLDTEVIPNANYSVSSGTITVNNSGVYWISYTMCFNQIDIDADAREALSAWVECNGAVISGSYSRNYFREAVFGGGISSTFLASLPSSCDVEVKFKYLAGGPNMDTVANESQVSMTKVG